MRALFVAMTIAAVCMFALAHNANANHSPHGCQLQESLEPIGQPWIGPDGSTWQNYAMVPQVACWDNQGNISWGDFGDLQPFGNQYGEEYFDPYYYDSSYQW